MALNARNAEEPLQGFKVIQLHYSADPEKDEQWARKIRRELPTEDWLREYELTATGRDTDHPVYSDWKRDLHERTLRYDPKMPVVVRGWDFGRVHPACLWLQVSGPEINVLHESVGTEIQLEQFALEVIARSQSWFPGVTRYVDWVDPHGEAEKDDGRASVKVLKDCGIHPKFFHLDVESGVLKVGQQLIRIVPGGRPALCADPRECPVLCDAMRGGYKRNRRGIIVKDGWFEHPADALRYGVLGIVKSVGGVDRHLQSAKEFRYQPRNQFTGY